MLTSIFFQVFVGRLRWLSLRRKKLLMSIISQILAGTITRK